MAAELVLSQAEKDALLLRLDAATMEDGTASTPSQKDVELALVLWETINAVTIT